ALFGLAAEGVKEVWGTLVDTFGKPLQLAANLERAKTSMVGLAGSVEGADKLVEDLRKMAGESGGLFNLEALTQASRGMLAVGFNTEQTVASLKMMGDVAAAMGEPIGEIASHFDRIYTTNHLSSRELRSMSALVPPLAESLGVSTDEVRKLAEQ